MSEPSTPSPIEAPPPAYEVAQLDFDHKLSIAAERSLDISEQRCQHQQEDAVVDREAGEDALGRSRESDASRNSDSRSVGHTPAVRPLAFRKKPRRKEEGGASDKERPSWFAEARLGASTSVPGVSRRPLPEPGQTRGLNARSQQHILRKDPNEDRTYPPPPFALVDNSLDGPPYEAYAANNVRRRTGNTVVLRYTGEGLAASPPPSPPHSPIARHSSQNSLSRQRAGSPHINPLNNAYPHVSQQSQFQVQIPVARPRSAESQRYIPPPRLNFNHSIAYEGSKSIFYGQLPAGPEETTHDATALYSSSVAPHLTSQKARLAPPPVKRRYTPSVTSLPEYDQSQQHDTNVSTGKSPYSVQDYAASRVSVYSQSSVGSAQQYPHIAQYPQMAQYPTQQNYTRPMSIARQGDAQHWSTSTINRPRESQYYPR